MKSIPYPLYARLLRWGGYALVLSIIIFILTPVLVVTIASLNDKAILSFPPQAWSFRWFRRAFSYQDFRTSFVSSAIVTAWASSIALVIGATLAIAIKRYHFAHKEALQTVLMSPLIIPHFTIGLGLLILNAQFDVERGFAIVVVCHVILVLPFVLRSIYVSLENLDLQIERAAASLGASPLRVITTITLPLLAPGLFGGWLFAAIMSFNEFTASLFITTQATQTLPVVMYNYVREFADPTLAALSVIYIILTSVVLIIANMFFGLGKVLSVESGH